MREIPNSPTRPFLVTAEGAPDLTRGIARSARFTAPSRGLRIPRELRPELMVRGEAVMLAARNDAALWGPSAALVLGLPIPRRLEDGRVHVLVPEGRPRMRRSGVRTRQADIVRSEIVLVDGYRVTSPARTYCDLSSLLGAADLLAVGDAAMRVNGVTRGEFAYVIKRRLRYSGKVRARQVAPWICPRAESPQESRTRAHLIFNGLPEPAVNMDIADEHGQFLARGDLVYVQWRIVVEYDGAVHGDEGQRRKDAARRTLLREHGWHVVELTADDLLVPQRAVSKVQAAIRMHALDASSDVVRFSA